MFTRRQEWDSLLAHIENNVMPEPNSGCLLWLGALDSSGYAQLRANNRTYYVHRLYTELKTGVLFGDQQALHKCDVRCCVNPDHLYAGAPADNHRDMRNRNRVDRGERRSNKLTDEDVLAIRSSNEFHYVIGARYGISKQQVQRIKARKQWTHI